MYEFQLSSPDRWTDIGRQSRLGEIPSLLYRPTTKDMDGLDTLGRV